MKDDLRARFAALSIPEFRRRVDLAVGHVRELRRAVAVEAGMTLEDMLAPIPVLDPAQDKRIYEEIMEMLPLRRTPLSPEERAALIRPTAAQRAAAKDFLDRIAENREAFDAAANELGLGVSSEQALALREEMVKDEMLGEVQREMEVFRDELAAYKARLTEDVAESLTRMQGSRGPAN